MDQHIQILLNSANIIDNIVYTEGWYVESTYNTCTISTHRRSFSTRDIRYVLEAFSIVDMDDLFYDISDHVYIFYDNDGISISIRYSNDMREYVYNTISTSSIIRHSNDILGVIANRFPSFNMYDSMSNLYRELHRYEKLQSTDAYKLYNIMSRYKALTYSVSACTDTVTVTSTSIRKISIDEYVHIFPGSVYVDDVVIIPSSNPHRFVEDTYDIGMFHGINLGNRKDDVVSLDIEVIHR